MCIRAFLSSWHKLNLLNAQVAICPGQGVELPSMQILPVNGLQLLEIYCDEHARWMPSYTAERRVLPVSAMQLID